MFTELNCPSCQDVMIVSREMIFGRKRCKKCKSELLVWISSEDVLSLELAPTEDELHADRRPPTSPEAPRQPLILRPQCSKCYKSLNIRLGQVALCEECANAAASKVVRANSTTPSISPSTASASTVSGIAFFWYVAAIASAVSGIGLSIFFVWVNADNPNAASRVKSQEEYVKTLGERKVTGNDEVELRHFAKYRQEKHKIAELKEQTDFGDSVKLVLCVICCLFAGGVGTVKCLIEAEKS